MQAYSLDLRQKIVDARLKDHLSYRAIAEKFDVALSFVCKILKQWRETGDISPRPCGGGNPMKLSPDQIIIVGDIVTDKNDLTLPEIRDELEKRASVLVSCSTISRVLASLGFTRKKKRYKQVKKIRTGFNSLEVSTGKG
jgi:transposase